MLIEVRAPDPLNVSLEQREVLILPAGDLLLAAIGAAPS